MDYILRYFFIFTMLLFLGIADTEAADQKLDFGPAFDNYPAGATDLVPRSHPYQMRPNLRPHLKPRMTIEMSSEHSNRVIFDDTPGITQSVNGPLSKHFRDLEERMKRLEQENLQLRMDIAELRSTIAVLQIEKLRTLTEED